MNGLLTLAGKMQSNVVLSAIKNAFIDNMPVVIWGCFLYSILVRMMSDWWCIRPKNRRNDLLHFLR